MKKHKFRAKNDKVMRSARKAIDDICAEADKELEAVAVEMFGSVDSHEDDGMGPPDVPVQVECWHCGTKYSSSEMVRAYRPRCQAALVDMLGRGAETLEPIWWCKHSDCDGGGFGHDIHPVEVRRKGVAP
jgi:hypothetical protein